MELPKIVKRLLEECDGYLVGSTAEKLYYQSKGVDIALLTKDWDIIIPPNNFHTALLVCRDFTFIEFKRLGGIKLGDGEVVVDLWPVTLGKHFDTLPSRYPGYAMNRDMQFVKRL